MSVRWVFVCVCVCCVCVCVCLYFVLCYFVTCASAAHAGKMRSRPSTMANTMIVKIPPDETFPPWSVFRPYEPGFGQWTKFGKAQTCKEVLEYILSRIEVPVDECKLVIVPSLTYVMSKGTCVPSPAGHVIMKLCWWTKSVTRHG